MMIVSAIMIYLWGGLVVGLLFIAFGIERVDPATRGAYAFRPLLLPGVILLWPYILRRWAAKGFW